MKHSPAKMQTSETDNLKLVLTITTMALKAIDLEAIDHRKRKQVKVAIRQGMKALKQPA